ncbi:Alpha/Beta hydrolase protein [Mycena leptocephala]|nr:Alpha/Beta hydrolase protein [Mycena leptocephala]
MALHIRQPVSLLTTIRLSIHAFLTKHLSAFGMAYLKSLDRPFWASVSPTLIKTYACRPHLRDNRIHLPPPTAQASGTPSSSSSTAAVSLHPRAFPTPLRDVAALIAAVLADEELLALMDTDKLVIAGFSAGATMTLALAQLPELKHRIKALVPLQPLTDWSGGLRDASRGRTTAWGTKERLPEEQAMFDWAYVPVGADMRDPLLSPGFASRVDIPQPVFFVTGSDDSLCDEAAVLARKLAVGMRLGVDVMESWASDGVRYECVKDMPHCFPHFWVRPTDKVWEARRKDAVEDIWGRSLLG